MLSVQELIDFEADIAQEFNAGNIRAPIHLSGGNEKHLLRIFSDWREGDWVFSNWRNHYHALLAGMPKEEVKRQIMAGKSMTVCSPKHRVFSSAIVGGIIPIATGVAWQIKRNKGTEKVWCFIGDMAAMSGIAMECAQYADSYDLPIIWVIEHNKKSVCTITADTWGHDYPLLTQKHKMYDYTLPWPHSGAGKRIQF